MIDEKRKKNGMQFLKVPYEFFNLIGIYEVDEKKIKIDTLDVLIISKIHELLDFNMDCFISDEGFAELFHTSRSTIQRSIKNLKLLGLIISETYMTSSCGQQTKHRNLFVNDNAIKEMIKNKNVSQNGSVKNDISKRQNQAKVASKIAKASVNSEAITENENKNNIKIKEKHCLSSIPDGIKDLMKDIGINYQDNTDNEIKKIIGEDIDYTVLSRVVEKNKSAFMKHKSNGQNYLFGILKAIVKEKYNEYARKIEGERLEREADLKRMMEESQIDYSRIYQIANNNRKKENLIDISAIANDILWLDKCDSQENDASVEDGYLEVVYEDDDFCPYTIDSDGNKVYSSPSLRMLDEMKERNELQYTI